MDPELLRCYPELKEEYEKKETYTPRIKPIDYRCVLCKTSTLNGEWTHCVKDRETKQQTIFRFCINCMCHKIEEVDKKIEWRQRMVHPDGSRSVFFCTICDALIHQNSFEWGDQKCYKCQYPDPPVMN